MSSMDGTFVCCLALKRLLARFESLKSNPLFRSLSQKGEELTDVDVVNAIAEPFLHPSYTIPIMGCFRPINQKIVAKAVEILLKVPELGKDSSEESTSEIEDENLHVIDFYLSKGKGLILHEMACLALCRALDLSTLVRGPILEYFKSSFFPFRRFSTITDGQLLKQDILLLRRACYITFRFLYLGSKDICKFWNWSILMDKLENFISGRFFCNSNTSSDMLDIKWTLIQIVSVVFGMSDRACIKFGLEEAETFTCFFRWEKFCQDTAVEKASCYIQASEKESKEYFGEMSNSSSDTFTAKSFCLRPCYQGKDFQQEGRMICSSKLNFEENSFVMTSGLTKCSEMVLMAVNQKWPVLLHGPSGSGKTSLIKMLSASYGSKVLFIHMDNQMDGKTLIGTYICAEQPGQFRWQPGSLTQAVLNGFWLVLEGIDNAPSEVHSTLLPLLEGSTSFATGHGEAVTVAENFRLFATLSSPKLDNFHGKNSFSALWRRVMVPRPSSKDLLKIMNKQYPSLGLYTLKLLETFERANCIAYNDIRGFNYSDSEFTLLADLRKYSLRHLLKLCERLAASSCLFSTVPFSPSTCKHIYQEAVDVFASFPSSPDHRIAMMKEIARIWSIPVEEVDNLYPPHKPTIQSLKSTLQIGRITLKCSLDAGPINTSRQNRPFANLRSSLHVLERIACCVKYNEPLLLVGETGTGKTTLVQNLAARLGQPLTVLNLSQQSDIADLLGGFRPINARSVCLPLYEEFVELFCKTFRKTANASRLHYYEKYIMEKKWKILLDALQKCVQEVLLLFIKEKVPSPGTKRKRSLGMDVLETWQSFSDKLNFACKTVSSAACMSFSFVEGTFINALRHGHWILFDEVNLAPEETLQRITGVLDERNGSICLAERGDISHVERHASFRIFACMNPATDTGKRELPDFLRSRFTEVFVDDVLDDDDLYLFVRQFMEGMNCDGEKLRQIVIFYKLVKNESEVRLQDGANQKPQFSLRSLARALEYTRKAEKVFGLQRAIFDGFSMFFLTPLDGPSRKIMNRIILTHLMRGKVPSNVPFDHYFTEVSCDSGVMDNYILTESVKGHLKSLARAIFIKRYPVLLQGPTSSGKTSLVQYLASVTGHEFVRINNHDHTDLEEYFGSYTTNSFGKLEFQEGVLVKAVRKGHWIVLDELNLAPSDVLEALNRLLDDNRELFVPELQEAISAHPNFMLFGTQNPPVLYGGRKMLSRAFRNRFIEIHVDEIPEAELSTILEKRGKVPQSHAVKMVNVLKDLQLHRQNSKVFAGKHGFITPRDLFRWANRFHIFGKSYEDLARDGYFLLAERLREESERNVVQEVLERCLHVKMQNFSLYPKASGVPSGCSGEAKPIAAQGHPGSVVWTASMEKLYFLVERCYKLREPVLLVGETGGGKTTVCQLLSAALGLKLHILNCHQYTESSDFVGGFRPVRDRSKLLAKYKRQINNLKETKLFPQLGIELDFLLNIDNCSSILSSINKVINHNKMDTNMLAEFKALEKIKQKLISLHQKWQTLFIWQDGPLVQAMNDGDLFLVDEISLADDSVLERLNSVLEPERTLSLAEKGGVTLDKITAHPNFLILATMNPGGDYGKKELSPALRNRFTEIWVPSVSNINEVRDIALGRLATCQLSQFVDPPMLRFWEWYNHIQVGRILTVRDLLSWIDFMNVTAKNLGPSSAFIHGAFMILLDGLSLGTGMSKSEAIKLRSTCFSFLLEQLKVSASSFYSAELSKIENYGWGHAENNNVSCYSLNDSSDNLFGISPFFIKKGPMETKQEGFEFLAPTTCRNASRLLRAMQLQKPVLLEGSPGVGKTSLVSALGKYSGHSVVRINLSEQTDLMDLLGSDLPVNSNNKIEFGWSDGILLQAIKAGKWVLLDELNLAPQSVLEGLNSILDHRSEVYVPDIGLKFKCPPSFRVFACQNPSCQGGGRKGLPKSFLNRFTKVYVDELLPSDYLFICRSLHPSIPTPILTKLIAFNKHVYEDTMLHRKYGQVGSPWEFNLRDVIRSCQIIEDAPDKIKQESFLNVIYAKRMRTRADRMEVMKCYENIFGVKPFVDHSPKVYINKEYFVVGSGRVMRNYYQPAKTLTSSLNISTQVAYELEDILHCISHKWLCILVGPPSSGKTSLVRLLAQITGNSLIELNLSPGTDVSELLGCFEQYSALDRFKSLKSKIGRYVCEYYSLRQHKHLESIIADRKHMITRWFSLMEFMESEPSHKVFSCISSLDLFVEIIEKFIFDLKSHDLPLSWSKEDLEKVLVSAKELNQTINVPQMSRFQWTPGDLIKAIEDGVWVVLDNANLCNPTVLDRINSLVEPDGLMTVNECGLLDGKPLVVKPHKNFRMFLTCDPKYGEVSRAMRNRGVEIFIQSDLSPVEEETADLRDDVKNFLIYSGIPNCRLIDTMTDVHIYCKEVALRHGVDITLLELTRWIQLFQQLVVSGNQPTWSLHLSWEHTYPSLLGNTATQEIIPHVKCLNMSDQVWSSKSLLRGGSFAQPGGWPNPLNLRRVTWFSQESLIIQNCLYLEFLAAQYSSYELGISRNKLLTLNDLKKLKPESLPVHFIYNHIFPIVSDNFISSYDDAEKPDLQLTKKMLQIAAKWTIEQVSPDDFDLYMLRFEWYSSQLQPECSFLKLFFSSLKDIKCHPIWKTITYCWGEITCQTAADQHQLLTYIWDWVGPDDQLMFYKKRMCRAINCLPLLFDSFQQWNTEKHCYKLKQNQFHCSISDLFKSLRYLEEDVLNMVIESDLFEQFIQIYHNLLDLHTFFWNTLTPFQHVHAVVAWHLLKKEVLKLKDIFPTKVNSLLAETSKLSKLLPLSLEISKPLLWLYGGHPLLSSTVKQHDIMQQLWSFCNAVWPGTMELWKLATSDNDNSIEVALSYNAEIKRLVVKGICISSSILPNDPNTLDAIEVEEIYQSLSRRFDYEKSNLSASSKYGDKNVTVHKNISCGCCVLCPEILSNGIGISCWVATSLLLDWKSFSLDTLILGELSTSVLLSPSEMHKPQLDSSLSRLLNYALDYSLEFSSRHPIAFAPHQKILWLFDAWESINCVDVALASVIHEMWFEWHSSLWNCYSQPFKDYLCSFNANAFLLLQPLRTATIGRLLQGSCPLNKYEDHCLKLRVASQAFREGIPSGEGVLSILFSTMRSLFQQILFVHRKSFDDSEFKNLESKILSLQDNPPTEEILQSIQKLILRSNHERLTLLTPLIGLLLRQLYCKWPSSEFLHNLGLGWIRIGTLRFHLLFNKDDPDPTLKYIFQHSQVLEKISLLELEMKVRQKCENLAWRRWTSGSRKKIESSLLELHTKRNKLQRKMVFRSGLADYDSLKAEIVGFLKLVSSCMDLAMGVHSSNADISLAVNRAYNWQQTATQFIRILTEKYASYKDIIQPIQVAIYEMKLGLSLVISDALEKEYLKKIEETSNKKILELICSLVCFPRAFHAEAGIVNLEKLPINSTREDISTALSVKISLFNKLVVLSTQDDDSTLVSTAQMQALCAQMEASVYHITLFLLVSSLSNSLVMCNSLFLLMDKIFVYFTNLWMDMKDQTRANEDSEIHVISFKPRAIMIENILKVDSSLFNDTYMEESSTPNSVETLMEYEFAKVMGAFDNSRNLEEEWNAIKDSVLKDVVRFHCQVFGSSDLLVPPGKIQVTDTEKLRFFSKAYKLGLKLTKGLPAIMSSMIEENLVPEHLFNICLEYGVASSQPPLNNVYKDPNAPEMAKMKKMLVTLQQRVNDLLLFLTDHPGLQRIVDIIGVLLTMPVSTPISQVLLGLQILLCRGHSLQENSSGIKIKDELLPIYCIVRSWQKMELGCWPFLLDEVEEQHTTNAAKLWFALSSVLYRDISGNCQTENSLTIESLEEFIQTASIGEFKKRLQLLFSFHGQFDTSLCLNAHARCHFADNLKILYNIFGYYIQFLPLIVEHISSQRKDIEKELIQLLKLYKWEEHQFSYLSIESFRRTRQKIMKLIKKYNDILQQPVMVILNDGSLLSRDKYSIWLNEKVCDGMDKEPVQSDLSSTERYEWYTELKKKVDCSINNHVHSQSLYINETVHHLKNLMLPLEAGKFQTGWEVGWLLLEDIRDNAAAFANAWKYGKKNLKKRRALADLLKNLDKFGLLRHSSLNLQLESCNSFLQPSFVMKHLLLIEDKSCDKREVGSIRHLQIDSNGKDTIEWQLANKCYFRNLSLRQQVKQTSLNFHKDLTVEQVQRAISFVDHLILIQQDQRAVAYNFEKQLNNLKKLVISMEHIGSVEKSLSSDQYVFIGCMWKQKDIFDKLLSLSTDVSLFISSIKNTHLDTCNTTNSELEFLSFINKFLPLFKQSKKSLDRYLLGCNDRFATMVSRCPIDVIVSKDMEQFVKQNFQIIVEFEDGLEAFPLHATSLRSMKKLITSYSEVITKGMIAKKNLYMELEERGCENGAITKEIFNKHKEDYFLAFEETYKQLAEIFGSFSFLSHSSNIHEESCVEDFTSWKVIFESNITKLQLDLIHDLLIKMFIAGAEFQKHSGQMKVEASSEIEIHMRSIYVLIDAMFYLGSGILSELLSLHRTVSELSTMLAHIFITLFSKGFGDTEDGCDDSDNQKFQDGTGTGLGEGEGINDVSDQIDDETQILGNNDQKNETFDNLSERNKDEKGIEMDENFAAETFSVSEDSDSDGDGCEEDDLNLESLMGEKGDGSQAVQEKLPDNDEDECSDDHNEKYEHGTSVEEKNTSDRELRAKDDADDNMDDRFDDESDALNERGENDDSMHDNEEDNSENALDKDNGFDDPTGLELDDEREKVNDQKEEAENIDQEMEENIDTVSEDQQGFGEEEEMDTEITDQDIGSGGNPNPDDNDTQNPSQEIEDNNFGDKRDVDNNEKMNIESMSIAKGPDQMMMEAIHDPLVGTGTADQINGPHVQEHRTFASADQPESTETLLGPSCSLPSANVSTMNKAMPDSTGESKFDTCESKLPPDSRSAERIQPNPYRNVGDALKDWKERVKIASDVQDPTAELPESVDDQNADEYQFVSSMEKGTSQAFGSATAEQIMTDCMPMDHDTDADHIKQKDNITEEPEGLQGDSLTNYSKMHEASEVELLQASLNCDVEMEESDVNVSENQSVDFMSFRKEFLSEENLNVSDSLANNTIQKIDLEIEKLSDDIKGKAILEWKKHELVTNKQSLELSEKLRLIMQPTVASKLEGDYKTGKRINMKKVIPYIASQYRKDKIWLRRTRPNKRDYQVVIAVDDSLSMAESQCGNVAMESLVTVCRAMSQLEVGQLAVASFGEKGNVRLLHDFDQPFSREAGLKMISSFSFKQDNTIIDEPMVDLLVYLNDMLDAAVSKARLPSGSNPLQQLILIIADGRFHEKEKLKRYVRDVLSRKRMIAFLLMDSAQESIMELMEASFQGEKLSFTKYMNTFPFPYYVVLKNVEALPRTLADLLSQWFELMQSSLNM